LYEAMIESNEEMLLREALKEGSKGRQLKR
jgi:hypothetical protein